MKASPIVYYAEKYHLGSTMYVIDFLAKKLYTGGVYKDLMLKEEYFSQALYTFDIGQNDLTAFYFLNQSAGEYIPNALKEFSKVVKV